MSGRRRGQPQQRVLVPGVALQRLRRPGQRREGPRSRGGGGLVQGAGGRAGVARRAHGAGDGGGSGRHGRRGEGARRGAPGGNLQAGGGGGSPELGSMVTFGMFSFFELNMYVSYEVQMTIL